MDSINRGFRERLDPRSWYFFSQRSTTQSDATHKSLKSMFAGESREREYVSSRGNIFRDICLEARLTRKKKNIERTDESFDKVHKQVSQIVPVRGRNSCRFNNYIARSNYFFVSKFQSADARRTGQGKRRGTIKDGKFDLESSKGLDEPGNPSPALTISEFRASEPNVRGETEKPRAEGQELPLARTKKSRIIESGKFDFWTSQRK